MTWARVGAAILVGGVALAAIADTHFAELATEIDARRSEVLESGSRKQRKAIRFATRELRRVDRGLVRDVSIAKRVTKRLDRAFPGDAALDALLDHLLADLSGEVANTLFDVEAELPTGVADGPKGRAARLAERARDAEAAAAATDDTTRAFGHLRRAARRVRRAEKELERSLSAPFIINDDPATPDGPESGETTMRLIGATFATQNIDAELAVGLVAEWRLDAEWRSPAGLGVSLRWPITGFPLRSYDFETTATGSLTSGGVTYDRNVTGQVRLTYAQTNNHTGNHAFRGEFDISATNAAGTRITATGTFDVQEAPLVIEPPQR